MKFFLDSAHVNEIQYALDAFNIDGVTTNPRHVQVSGKPFLTVVREIAKLVEGTDKTVSVEVNPHFMTYEEMMPEAEKLAAMSPNFVIKLQCVEPAFKVIEASGKERHPCKLHPDFLSHAGAAGHAFRCLLHLAFYRLERNQWRRR